MIPVIVGSGVANYFWIAKDDTDYNPDRAGLVFLPTTYWLADSRNNLGGYALLVGVSRVSQTALSYSPLYDGMNYTCDPSSGFYNATYSIRPVVVLNDDVQCTYSNVGITLK